MKEINYYERVSTLLYWDMYTQTPPKGFEGMADALTFFSSKAFDLSTSDEFFSLLKESASSPLFPELDEGTRFSVKKLLKDLEKQRRIPSDFYREFVAEKSKAMNLWEQAKHEADYSIFAPSLERLICMTGEMCGYTDPGKEVYDVLLDQYEEGMDSASIDKTFSQLKEGLMPILDEILSRQTSASDIYDGTYDPDDQKKVQRLLLEYIGFDFEAGAAAESEHPFTLGFSAKDVRVTNHYHLHNPIGAMFSAIHEGGHAIFDQNTDPALEGTIAWECNYMGVHESQSRFFENILGRRKSFWIPVYDKIQELLPDLRKIPLDDFVREIQHVRRSLIRTEADEVTYCLHIILRYEIEQEIFRNKYPVADLPALWNEKMNQYLGLIPASDAEGILQDMHWSDASFGYFPSYLLGSIYDGMFLDALTADLGNIDLILETGNIRKIREWLNEKIHRYGNLRLPADVIREVCGKPLSAEPLLRHFRDRYLR